MNHSFDINLATEYGVQSAIIIHHFQHWVMVNKRLNRNFIDGRTWSYQTLKEIAANFPYLSVKQIERIITKLVDLKVLIKGNYNKSAYDRTIWYAFADEEKFSISRFREMDFSESGNENPEIGKSNTDAKPDTKTVVCSRENGSVSADADSSRFVKSCKKKHPDGHIQEISMESILTQSVQKRSDFTVDEIELAWEALIKTDNPVRNPYRFIEGTITNIRNSSNKQNRTKERNPCQKDLSNTAHLTKRSEKPRGDYLVSVLIPPTFLKYSYETMIAKKS